MSARTRLETAIAITVMLGAVLVWLWPIGLGGAMPVGGDVTQFSIGLMACLSRSLASHRLPYWNDLWGYGFPGIGESQMGVYYPPHWLLYGLLPVEAAYTASLVGHTLWGSLGTWWAARKMGASPTGAALSGFAWSTSGFFLIHISHQWGTTTGCWLPWAWGLTWVTLTNTRRIRPALLLALVLCVQLLPGHFQLAFITQVGVVALALNQLVTRSGQGRPEIAGTAHVLAAWLGSFALAAAQIIPTLRLARLAASDRDFEYLSGFAVTPVHLLTWLAPGLFERSPLWRPIVWDPFHTSPEEYLGYIGLVPLLLALIRIGSGWKQSGPARALLVTGLVCLALSLGPYLPGFRLFCRLPGFSFFRAPARWMIGTSLALAILAGLGFDILVDQKDAGRAIRRFVLLTCALVGLGVGLVECGMLAGDGTLPTPIRSVFQVTLDALPWGERGVYDQILASADRPNRDLRVQESWARQGIALVSAPRPVFRVLRWSIYREELLGTAAILVILLVVSSFSRRTNWLRAGLIGLTLVDLWLVGRHRRIDTGPIRSLVHQSPVLTQLERAPGARSVDPLRNLPMVAGVAPVSSYRTLDLPALEGLTTLALQAPVNLESAEIIHRAEVLSGASIRIVDPFEVERRLRLRNDHEDLAPHLVHDPTLAGWRYGVDWVTQVGDRATRFLIEPVSGGGVRAWFLPENEKFRTGLVAERAVNPTEILSTLADAQPLKVSRPDPEHLTVDYDVAGPGLILVTQLADPQWTATQKWNGRVEPVPIRRAFGREGAGAWQLMSVAEAGRGTLELAYRADDVFLGLAVSGFALLIWGGLWLGAGRFDRQDSPTGLSSETETQ
ncbi:MAG: hypothetical protein U0794_05070 [Isosphaeraceae bacterium]